MYCIECGAQIPENSKFCSHCGKRQDESQPSLKEQLAEHIIEKEITRQVIEEHKKSLDYQFLRKAMGWYLAWVLLHFCLLLIGSKDILGKSSWNYGFWPFSDGIEYYDIREFLVYIILPAAILIILSMVRTHPKSNDK